MSRQPVRVQIFNQHYSLLVDSDPAEVQQIAHQVGVMRPERFSFRAAVERAARLGLRRGP